MRTSLASGLVFANSNDNLLKELTEKRPMASVPFGARYRLIDFTLSNLSNAGITNVGIITTHNNTSLIDYVGNGTHWGLDRKNGGLRILSPDRPDGKDFKGTIDALKIATEFIKRCGSEYIVLCASDILGNIDIGAAVNKHAETGADITVVYHKGVLPANREDSMVFTFDKDGRVTRIELETTSNQELDYGIGITIISRKLLFVLIVGACDNNLTSFNRDILANKVNELKIMGFNHSDFVILMNGMDTYYQASMALLNQDVRRQLFNPERPIYKKNRDETPTRYGIESDVKNCFIGNGCVIDGIVRNSILFPNVKVEKGAVVENCILMPDSNVRSGAKIQNVITDKNAVIAPNSVMKASSDTQFYIAKT
ncbi:MAG: glucose-1-phosphate adenylyltransferase subunit GlgD [Acutalibacteraceae bacterium]|jgi:glucose-1-phosphate adenylyltransferase